jgi:hypothetical protein
MNYHLPVTQNVISRVPTFLIHNGELICPQKMYKKQQYPNLPNDMVKITGRNGQNIYVPASKLKTLSQMDAEF